MSDELGWTRVERRRQVKAAVAYFETMGSVPGDVVADKGSVERREKDRKGVVDGVLRELEPKGMVEKVERAVGKMITGVWGALNARGLVFGSWMGEGVTSLGAGTNVGLYGVAEHGGPFKKAYGRARFGAGEIIALRNAFTKRANVEEEQPCVDVNELVEVMHDVLGYEGVKDKDLKYVLEENGMMAKDVVDFDEFLEVSGQFWRGVLPTEGYRRSAVT
jgi:glycerol-3-phosphate dehydrogenase